MDTPFNDNSNPNEPDDIGSASDSSNALLGGFAGIVSSTLAQGSTSASAAAPQIKKEDDLSNASKSHVVTARGTSDGLILRIDGRVNSSDLLSAVKEFLTSRRSFLTGNDVAFEWVGKKPEDQVISQLTSLLAEGYSVSVRSSKMRSASTQTLTGVPNSSSLGLSSPATSSQEVTKTPFTLPLSSKISAEPTPQERPVSLFDGMDGFDSRTSAAGSMLWDEPDARVIYGTLRSGQKIETEHSVVVFGDVNSGAEVIAGGDIVILGTLRGIAHAGAYDESGGGRVIFSLNLQATQLRVGLVISRGPGADRVGSEAARFPVPEVARVDNNTIVVEPYQSRTVWMRRRE